VNIAATYDYLTRARRDLWRTLEAVPDALLSRPLIEGVRFECLKDYVFHIAEVEDGWINGDIRGGPMLQRAIPELRDAGPSFAAIPLGTLLDYWRVVEGETLRYLASLTEHDLARVVPLEDWPEKQLTVGALLSHVMIHEIRHTAQLCVLLRSQGVAPPSLDLLFYL